VRCHAHNLLEAERAFGREHVERCIIIFPAQVRRSPLRHPSRDARRPARPCRRSAAMTSSEKARSWAHGPRLHAATPPSGITKRVGARDLGSFAWRSRPGAVELADRRLASRRGADAGDMNRRASRGAQKPQGPPRRAQADALRDTRRGASS
jgi:hypothetical protein